MVNKESFDLRLHNLIARQRAETDAVFYGTGFLLKHNDGRQEWIYAPAVMIDKNADGYRIQGRDGLFQLQTVTAPEFDENS